jgi:hypothetical protein
MAKLILFSAVGIARPERPLENGEHAHILAVGVAQEDDNPPVNQFPLSAITARWHDFDDMAV